MAPLSLLLSLPGRSCSTARLTSRAWRACHTLMPVGIVCVGHICACLFDRKASANNPLALGACVHAHHWYVCTHVYTHVCTHARTRVHTHVAAKRPDACGVRTHTCMHASHAYTHTCIHPATHALTQGGAGTASVRVVCGRGAGCAGFGGTSPRLSPAAL